MDQLLTPFVMEENQEVAHAVAALICFVVVPPLVRLRVVYTFLWAAFALLALASQSKTALGLATAMGLAVSLSWYRLRAFDQSVFDSVLLGWFGFLSKYRAFCWLASSCDFLLHFIFPAALTLAYLPFVQLWMTVPILIFSALWVYLVADGSLTANHVYHFSPPRPPKFWFIAYSSMLIANLTVPLGCVVALRSGVYELLVHLALHATGCASVALDALSGVSSVLL